MASKTVILNSYGIKPTLEEIFIKVFTKVLTLKFDVLPKRLSDIDYIQKKTERVKQIKKKKGS